MRICMFVSNDLLNEPRVTRHAETLAKSGHIVSVVCTGTDRKPALERQDSYFISRVSSVRRSSTYPSLSRLALDLVRMTYQFVRLGRQLNAHVYVSNDLDTLLPGALCARTTRKLIYDAHELWPDQFVGAGMVPSPLVALFRIIESVLSRRADAVITVNEFISTELESRYHCRRPYVILNVPRREPQTGPRGTKTRGIKVALYQGRYEKNRGLENVIRSCEFLRDDVMLAVRGYGQIETELRQIGKPFRNCRFDPPVLQSQLIWAASLADVGIVSYIPVNANNYFASPNKLFEYIQAGLPVVASDLPFLRKIVAENNIGYLFDPRDPRSIADAINTATTEDTLRLLRANVRKIKDRYSWEEEQGKLVAIIRDECGKSR